MSYTYLLCGSCDDINQSDWKAVCGQSGNPFMDIGFLRAVENGMTEPGKYWYANLYDESRSPVGCACFSLFIVDGALLAPSLFRRLAGPLRKLLPWFFRFKLLLCGLPVSTSAGQVVSLPDADWRQLAMTLDEIACGLAQGERAALISFKEFDEQLTANLSGLQDVGYRPAHSVTTFIFDAEFQSFDEYYQSRSKRTRANMRKSFRKFEDGGLRCVCLKGGEGVPK